MVMKTLAMALHSKEKERERERELNFDALSKVSAATPF